MPLTSSSLVIDHHRQSGFTLVELMVGLLVGMFIVFGATSFFIAYNKSNFDLLKGIRLEQELRATVDLISRDLRRAGFREGAHTGIGNPTYCDLGYVESCPSDGTTPVPRFTATGSTILYRYDSNLDGTAEDFGFRLNGGAVEYLSSAVWLSLTDGGSTTYTSLTFTPTVRFVDLDPTAPGTNGVRIRELTITVTANVTGEPNITRTVQEIVRIRNDEYVNL